MPQVYFNLPAEDLEMAGRLAEMEFDGNRSEVLRDAVSEYLHGPRRTTVPVTSADGTRVRSSPPPPVTTDQKAAG